MPRTLWLVGLMAVIGAAEAAAQTRYVEPVVVTATKVETPQERLGASVTVVTGDEIVDKQYPTV